MAIKEPIRPNNEKQHELVPGCHSMTFEHIDNVSVKMDSLRQVLKKPKERVWTEKHTAAFENLLKSHRNTVFCLQQLKLRERYNNRRQYKRGRDPTLWQEQSDRKLEQIRFASRFSSDTGPKHAINELDMLAAVLGSQHFLSFEYLW